VSVLKRSELRRPTLAKETVEVPELGGDVVVRGMLLSERMAAANEEENLERRMRSMPMVLSWCVLDADGEALMTVDEWQAFGGHHPMAAVRLFNVVQRLSLIHPEDVEKKSESTPNC